jgi:hypothetical protein
VQRWRLLGRLVSVDVTMTGTAHDAAGRSGVGSLAGVERGEAAVPVMDLFRSHHVELVRFGRLDGTKFTPLQAFPSPSSTGISGQSAAAW